MHHWVQRRVSFRFLAAPSAGSAPSPDADASRIRKQGTGKDAHDRAVGDIFIGGNGNGGNAAEKIPPSEQG